MAEEMDQLLGVIDACATSGCGYVCCQFTEGNYIALYPGEFEEAEAAGLSTTHLSVTPLRQGGFTAVCQAKNRGNCDGGYKPLDCQSYPFFPSINQGGEVVLGLKGKKCPLKEQSLKAHSGAILRRWSKLLRARPAISSWIREIRLIGYTKTR